MEEKKQSSADIKKLAIKAVMNGEKKGKVAELFNVDRVTLYRWLKEYDKSKSEESLQRKPGTGRNSILEEYIPELVKIAKHKASEYGFETDLWNTFRIAMVVKKKFRIRVSRVTIWRALIKAGLTYHKPEKRYFNSDEVKKQQEKWLKYKLPEIQETVSKYKAVLYWEDEASVQLSPVIGKTWAPKGETPVIEVTSKRGSIAAISAISLSGHLIFRLYDKKINSDVIIEFLKQMLDYHPKRHLVVIMDNASSHTSKKTSEFIASQKRLHVFTLPPYSPEFNPDEKVWNYLKNEKLKDHKANNKAELKKLVNKSLRSMSQDKNLLEGLFYRCNVAHYMK